MAATRFIIHGTHITENLEHHKASDVRRILEDKGYAEGTSSGDNSIHFTPESGGVQSEKQTVIGFDDSDFVLENGVEFVG